MYHTLAKQVARWTCNLVAGVSLPMLFLLLGSGQVVAQTSFSSANPTMANPARYSNIAVMFGITAYPLNQFTESNSAANLLQAINSMQPSVLDGSASAGVEFRFTYYSRVYRAITQYDMAVEVAMLQELLATNNTFRGTFPKAQLATVYAELVAIL